MVARRNTGGAWGNNCDMPGKPNSGTPTSPPIIEPVAVFLASSVCVGIPLMSQAPPGAQLNVVSMRAQSMPASSEMNSDVPPASKTVPTLPTKPPVPSILTVVLSWAIALGTAMPPVPNIVGTVAELLPNPRKPSAPMIKGKPVPAKLERTFALYPSETLV
jgi:hypothetical protein